MNKKNLKFLAIPFIVLSLTACNSDKEEVKEGVEVPVKTNEVVVNEVKEETPAETEEVISEEEVVEPTEPTSTVEPNVEEQPETVEPLEPTIPESSEPETPTSPVIEKGTWSFVGLADSHSAEFSTGSESVVVQFSEKNKNVINALESETKVNVSYYKNSFGQVVLENLEKVQ